MISRGATVLASDQVKSISALIVALAKRYQRDALRISTIDIWIRIFSFAMMRSASHSSICSALR